jgi:type IV secretory pathway VirB10-like protein
MQISSSFLVVCVAAAACVVVVSCAQKTDAHANVEAPQAPQAQAEASTNVDTSGKAAAQAQAPQAAQAQAEVKPKAEAADKAAAQTEAGNEAAKAEKVMAATQAELDKAAQAQAKAQADASREKKKASPPKAALVFKPLEAPPLPVSAEKEQKLSDLLRRYKADEVTPEQYQEQRAKILAGP